MNIPIDDLTSYIPSIGEKCAVFGVYGVHDASRVVWAGLYALQHRGQESSGISVSNGSRIHTYKDVGLVSHVYSENIMHLLDGDEIAIGHNRYGTHGGAGKDHAQPVDRYGGIAVAHNGNLPSVTMLQTFLNEHGVTTENCNDSEMMAAAIHYYISAGSTVEEAVIASYPLFTGAFSLLVLTKDTLIALRDGHGIRPLCIGTLNGGYVFSSETCALDTVQAKFVRDVKAGEMVIVDSNGMRSFQVTPGTEHIDVFEYIYFSRPDSILCGRSVYEVRKRLGFELANEFNRTADVVIPVPDSAIPAAIGFAQQSKIPYEEVLIKNRYIHRTFIEPSQKMRDKKVEMKLNPIGSILKDKIVVLVDDSIVRLTTAPKIVEMVRRAGAAEVHMVISSPPYVFPDFYGVDTPQQNKLAAFRRPLEEIRKLTTADSLSYLSYAGMVRAIGLPEEKLCTSVFTGKYPIDIRERKGEVEI